MWASTKKHTLIHIAQWAVPFYVTRWRVWVCDLVTSNRMIIEKKGLSMVSQHITTHSSWLQVHTVDQTVLPPPSIALFASVCLMAAGPLLFHAKNCRLQTALCLVFGVCDWLSVLPPPHPFRYDFLLLPWLLFDCFPRFKGSIPK